MNGGEAFNLSRLGLKERGPMVFCELGSEIVLKTSDKTWYANYTKTKQGVVSWNYYQ